jgi:hypothetical protein
VEPGAGEDLSSFHFPESRTEKLESFHEIPDEVRKLVHRLGQANERIRSFFVEPPHPGGDGERTHQEDSSRLGEGPASGGAKFEDRQSVSGRIMGSSVGLDLLHASVLDADLLTKEMDLLPESILLCLLPQLVVQTLRSPAVGQR